MPLSRIARTHLMYQFIILSLMFIVMGYYELLPEKKFYLFLAFLPMLLYQTLILLFYTELLPMPAWMTENLQSDIGAEPERSPESGKGSPNTNQSDAACRFSFNQPDSDKLIKESQTFGMLSRNIELSKRSPSVHTISPKNTNHTHVRQQYHLSPTAAMQKLEEYSLEPTVVSRKQISRGTTRGNVEENHTVSSNQGGYNSNLNAVSSNQGGFNISPADSSTQGGYNFNSTAVSANQGGYNSNRSAVLKRGYSQGAIAAMKKLEEFSQNHSAAMSRLGECRLSPTSSTKKQDGYHLSPIAELKNLEKSLNLNPRAKSAEKYDRNSTAASNSTEGYPPDSTGGVRKRENFKNLGDFSSDSDGSVSKPYRFKKPYFSQRLKRIDSSDIPSSSCRTEGYSSWKSSKNDITSAFPDSSSRIEDGASCSERFDELSQTGSSSTTENELTKSYSFPFRHKKRKTSTESEEDTKNKMVESYQPDFEEFQFGKRSVRRRSKSNTISPTAEEQTYISFADNIHREFSQSIEISSVSGLTNFSEQATSKSAGGSLSKFKQGFSNCISKMRKDISKIGNDKSKSKPKGAL